MVGGQSLNVGSTSTPSTRTRWYRNDETLRATSRGRAPCFRGVWWIRYVAETRRGRESMLARLPGLAAVYCEGIHRIVAVPGTAMRLMLSRPDDVGGER